MNKRILTLLIVFCLCFLGCAKDSDNTENEITVKKVDGGDVTFPQVSITEKQISEIVNIFENGTNIELSEEAGEVDFVSLHCANTQQMQTSFLSDTRPISGEGTYDVTILEEKVFYPESDNEYVYLFMYCRVDDSGFSPSALISADLDEGVLKLKFINYIHITADGMAISTGAYQVNLAIFKIARTSLSGDINALSIELIAKEI